MTITSALLLMTALSASEGAVGPVDGSGKSALRIIWDMNPSPQNAHVLDWLAARGWCWAVEVSPFATVETMRALRERGWRPSMDILGHPETRRRHWSRREGGTIPNPDDSPARLLEASDGGEAIAFYLIEDDSAGVAFPQELLRHKPRTHAAAKALFDAYLEEALAVARRHPQVRPWGMVGYAGSAHHYAAHGVACIIVERANDDVEDLQTAVAFARGAARQYGCAWGIDLSLWWGVFYGCVQDLPASLYTRHLYMSFFSGAQVFRIEGGDLLVDAASGPSLVAQAMDAFAQTVQHIEPGEADRPVAIMLPEDHGWMTPPYWRTGNEVWNYARTPYRPGDRGIDGVFGAAFPGSVYAMDPFPFGAYTDNEPPASPFSLSCITPEFAPAPADVYYAEPPLPFGRFAGRNDARAAMHSASMDPSPYRGMGDSRWGEIFDVLNTRAELPALQRYPVLMLAGPVRLDAALRRLLMEYVRGGGTLLLAAGVATPEDAALCGAAIQPELRTGRAWQWANDPPVHEAFRYVPVQVEEAAAMQVLARTPAGDPLLLQHSVGAGTVYTCLVPWYEAGHAPLCGAALRLFDHVIGLVQPVRAEGLPAAWLSTTGDGFRTVVIANNDGAPWQGRVIVRHVPENMGRCTDLRTGAPVPFSHTPSGAVTDLSIAPYDVRVIRWAEQ